MMPIKAILFDFDGTLAELNVDFIRMRKAVLDLMSNYCSVPDNIKDCYVLEMIDAGKELVFKNNPGRENDFFKKAHELICHIETAGSKKGRLLAGTREVLQLLREKRVKTGIVTRNCMAAIKQLFPDIDLHCDAVITREFTTQVKPHPIHLLTALDALDTDAHSAAMVGDHPMDITAGREAGTYTIGVLTGYSGFAALRDAGADMIIEKAADIPQVL